MQEAIGRMGERTNQCLLAEDDKIVSLAQK
jgi:hypothetical protein